MPGRYYDVELDSNSFEYGDYQNYSEGPGYGVGNYTTVNVPDVNSQAINSIEFTRPPNNLSVLQQFIKDIRKVELDKLTKTPASLTGVPLHSHCDMEKLDPLHRFPHFQRNGPVRGAADEDEIKSAKLVIVRFLADSNETKTTANFLKWIQQQPMKDQNSIRLIVEKWKGVDTNTLKLNGMVNYLDMIDRQKFVIEPQVGGNLFSRVLKSNAQKIFFDTESFDTSASKAAYRVEGIVRNNKAIWVQGPSGRFYSSNLSKAGKFHHSSFLGGGNVKAAGDWEVQGGKLLTISAISGHYRPPVETLLAAIKDLKQTSASILNGTKVEIFEKSSGNATPKYVKIPALEFLRNAENDKSYINNYVGAI